MSQERLDQLFHLLKTSQDEATVQQTIDEIWQVWMFHGNEEIDQLMEIGCKAMSDGDFSEAIVAFAEIINKDSNYAEGWNKKATALYLRGDYKKSIDDIKTTLIYEPRHFGALSGWATICLIIGDELGAYQAFKKLETIYPYRKGLKNKIKKLGKSLGFNEN